MFVMKHKSTKDSPSMHKGCTTDAPWVLRGCTMKAPRMHFGRTADAVWMHNGCTANSFTCTTDAPGMPHRCTTDALWTHWVHQECLMHALRMRLEYFLDLPWMIYGYPLMYHGRLTDRYSPWMYHGFSTHALLTLKLGHCPWTILFNYWTAATVGPNIFYLELAWKW